MSFALLALTALVIIGAISVVVVVRAVLVTNDDQGLFGGGSSLEEEGRLADRCSQKHALDAYDHASYRCAAALAGRGR